MKMTEVRSLSKSDLVKKMREDSEALFKIRVKRASGELTQTHTLKVHRRDIARMMTALREQEVTKA